MSYFKDDGKPRCLGVAHVLKCQVVQKEVTEAVIFCCKLHIVQEI